MSKRLVVTSPYPNLQGRYIESGTHDGRPAFVREACHAGHGESTCIFYSAKFGRGSSWYFARCFPQGGSLSSYCNSLDDGAASPEFSHWPAVDIVEIRDDAIPRVAIGIDVAPSIPPVAPLEPRAPPCQACSDLIALNAAFRCAACNQSASSQAMHALVLLKDLASNAVRQQLAKALASGDANAKQTLDDISAAHARQERTPIILVEPPSQIEVGAGTMTLACEAVSLIGAKLEYQWSKDGIPLRRAERPRFIFCGAGPQDEGAYLCHISAGAGSTSTRACQVKLSDVVAAGQARVESALRRAGEAKAAGNLEAAVLLFTEAIEAANCKELVRGNALCERAHLQLQLERWQNAFSDASDAVKISPGLARAHAARGAAAVKLGLLAEATSSWETAEFLGGVPEAAQEAENCRQRLNVFFAERQARSANAGLAGGQSAGHASEHDEPGSTGPEDAWKRSGWQGRYAGGSAGSFFGPGGAGSSGQGRGHGDGGYRKAPTAIATELQRNLEVLELSGSAAAGGLPSADVVRKAYRRLALQAHPDKQNGSTAAFQKLQNAYEAVLSAI